MFSYLYLAISFILANFITLRAGFLGKPIGILVLFLTMIFCYFFLFGVHIAVFALFGLTINLKHLPKSINNIYRKIGFDTVKVFLDTIHVKVHATGMEKVPEGKFLLVSNHRSCYDPMVQLLLFKKHNLAFVSKQENMDIPFVGRYMAAVGCIPLSREDNKEALKSINQTAESIRTGRANMGIYPEGRVNLTDEVLLPFRNGALRAAKKAPAQILVTTIRGTERIKHQFLRKNSHVYVDVLGVISEEEVKSFKTADLGEHVRNMMYENLVQHSIK
jgi:1-acyl-sn-glycerol-3-phosphate acyltransferase